ncbi:ActS/PrrB/RegB family redox-sensitive histidine kinase [Hyphobacterium sp. HN65]|uniref:histidine kinase n=1 Tax=Hyphobacterium lacteum TaxID=3116575 RepID=A0ABU7LTP0_9PROT|nr:ActS/PrrB/RegB family redox-sensitive histidine kinase [Hyphobacterium sp. HN65]MEE2527282.1 ActS/PrrB/RegB family redox-sensitive histidine kinase [Hyphobacterium sp. HN65]
MQTSYEFDSPTPPPGVAPFFGRVRLRTLIVLRWMAVVGQAATLLFVTLVLGFEVPLLLCCIVVAASAVLNLGLIISRDIQKLTSQHEAFAQLAFDVIQLSLLLVLTGGLQNPFVVMLVAPVTIGVAALPPRFSVGLAVLGLLGMGAMSLYSLPLPWIAGQTLNLPPLYEAGLGVAFVIAVSFTAAYAWRIGHEAKRMGAALTATQAILAREQKLSAVGSLAAAAAHELGTPLATIQLTAKEMAREIKDETLREDAELLVSQAKRCRDILQQLSAQRTARDKVHDRIAFRDALDEVCGPMRGLGASITIRMQGEGEPPVIARQPEFLYGLGNLIENAVEFAAGRVLIEGRWSEDGIGVIINDDGKGFAADVLGRIGEPYISRRNGEVGGGLGLGSFIAITMIERLGGRARFANGGELGGALIHVEWPRKQVEAPEEAD